MCVCVFCVSFLLPPLLLFLSGVSQSCKSFKFDGLQQVLFLHPRAARGIKCPREIVVHTAGKHFSICRGERGGGGGGLFNLL